MSKIHFAKLVTITPDAENLMAYCARVSSPNQQNSSITGLLKYCAKNNHWSVFEMANMVIEINTTLAIAPQILRHKSFSFQGFSQRYSDPKQESDNPLPSLVFSTENAEYRLQDHKNRQNSFDFDAEMDVIKHLRERQVQLAVLSQTLYADMVAEGIANEYARNVLPVCQPTRLYMNGNIRSWIHYIQLRVTPGTQKEHRLIAQSVLEIFKTQLPRVSEALFLN